MSTQAGVLYTPDVENNGDQMDLDSDVQSRSLVASSSAELVRDAANWLPRVRNLPVADVIILLTPVVIPSGQNANEGSDPFEPFGLALASRHSKIRQVPYTQRNLITSTHLGFIKRGQIIILCIASTPGEEVQTTVADIAFAVSDNKPCIIVICCNEVAELDLPFPTIIQTNGFSPDALEAAAALIFGEHNPLVILHPPTQSNERLPKLWQVEEWNESSDVPKVTALWNESVQECFMLDQQTLSSLLHRPGYAKHYIVREPEGDGILGFCATYLSYVDQVGEMLIASLAIIMVQSPSQGLGVGLSLHSYAISQLKRTRGIIRLQLGSTFPRILYGPPAHAELNDEWFRRRGWQLSKALPGQGQLVHDLVLEFSNWHSALGNLQPPSYELTFRPCIQNDTEEVLEAVNRFSARYGKMGWFDQYSFLMKSPNVNNIVLAINQSTIVATAIIYTPSDDNQTSSNLPWAGRIGHEVGGVTCICLHPNADDTVMEKLLDACMKCLRERGMTKMFLDGISDGIHSLQRLGFKEWACYRDVWKDI